MANGTDAVRRVQRHTPLPETEEPGLSSLDAFWSVPLFRVFH
jgi:hypothetical protein